MEASETLKRTSLHERHRAAGAKLVPFAGWEMPVQYEGVKPEHLAVRGAAGVFDVSHMGQVVTEGPDAEKLLQRVLSNDLSRLAEGGAQYSVLCRPDGGVIDDLFSYRLAPERFLTVTNAANHDRDRDWIREHAEGLDVEVRDAIDEWAMLAVQGPKAREIVAGLADGELPGRMRTAVVGVPGDESALICGTGYTGEDGVEIMLRPEGAPDLWDALLAAGVTPAGLGARDTLRLEVCFHLYGNDLSLERDPVTSGLGWVCREETGFIGSEVTASVRERGPSERLVAFSITDKGIPRQGNAILAAGEPAGEVTSGTMSPCLGYGVGMGFVRADLAEPGTELEIDVRGRTRAARVESRPLYSKPSDGA